MEERVRARPAAAPGDQSAYWTRVSGTKSFGHPLDRERFGARVPPSAHVLEIGCGYGRLLAELHGAGWRSLVGVDTARGMIERGHRQHPDLDLRQVARGPLPFPRASFDAVLLVAVLTCVPAPDQQLALVREVERVLRPGGTLFLSDLLLQSDERNTRRYAAGRTRYGLDGVFELPEGVVLCHLPPGRQHELLRAFEDVERWEVDLVTMNGHPARAFQLLATRREG